MQNVRFLLTNFVEFDCLLLQFRSNLVPNHAIYAPQSLPTVCIARHYLAYQRQPREGKLGKNFEFLWRNWKQEKKIIWNFLIFNKKKGWKLQKQEMTEAGSSSPLFGSPKAAKRRPRLPQRPQRRVPLLSALLPSLASSLQSTLENHYEQSTSYSEII